MDMGNLCFAFKSRTQPIAIQACLPFRILALHLNRSYGYGFRSSAAYSKRNPAPVLATLFRHAGLAQQEKG